MKQSQAEIKAIQAKLQAIQAGRSSVRSPSLPAMVELTPGSTTNSTTNGTITSKSNTTTHSKSNSTTISIMPVAIAPGTREQHFTSATATVSSQQESMREPTNLTAAAEALQQRSAVYVKQLQQPLARSHPRSPQLTQPIRAEQQIADALQRIEVQALRINQLSVEQEAALQELKAIAEKAERDWRAAELEREPFLTASSEIPAVCDYESTTVPYIEKDENGVFVLKTRPVDLFKAEREATLTAQALRYRVAQPSYSSSRRKGAAQRHSGRVQSLKFWGQAAWKQISAVIGVFSSAGVKVPAFKTASARQTAPLEMPSFSFQDAAIWVFGAVVTRIGLDLLLLSFPGLWVPVIGLIAAPAAIAVYYTTTAPQSGFIWGYRLLLIMVGLLIGGRL